MMTNLDFYINRNLIVGGDAKISGENVAIDVANISSSPPRAITDSDTVIDRISKSLLRSARYSIQVITTGSHQVSRILLVHDSNNSYMNEYGVIVTNGLPLATFSTEIDGNYVILKARMNMVGAAGIVYFNKTGIYTAGYDAP